MYFLYQQFYQYFIDIPIVIILRIFKNKEDKKSLLKSFP